MSCYVVRDAKKGTKGTSPLFGDTSAECEEQLCCMAEHHRDRKLGDE